MNTFARFAMLALLPLGVCHSAEGTLYLSTSNGPLQISAEIESKHWKSGEGVAYFGNVSVINTSESAAAFGNACLVLSVGPDASSRAYKDTVASEVIDFATVDVPAGNTLEESVYWVFVAPPSELSVFLSYGCKRES